METHPLTYDGWRLWWINAYRVSGYDEEKQIIYYYKIKRWRTAIEWYSRRNEFLDGGSAACKRSWIPKEKPIPSFPRRGNIRHQPMRRRSLGICSAGRKIPCRVILRWRLCCVDLCGQCVFAASVHTLYCRAIGQ